MRIAIVKLSAIGDIIHAMVVLQFIKKFNKDILIDWIIEDRHKDLVKKHPDINKIYTVNLKEAKKKLSLGLISKEMQKLRKLPLYDLVIDMQGLMKSAIVSRIIPSSSTLGFSSISTRERFASIFYNKTFNIGYEENVVKRNFELVKFALSMPFNFENLNGKKPFLFSSIGYRHSSLSSLKKNVILVSGASHPSKIYPAKKMAQLTKMIDANFIVTWGNQTEKDLAIEINKLSPKVIVSNKLSIDALICLVSKVDLVIGADTGPTHFAWALNIPSIVLFGPTPGNRNTVVSETNQIIESKSRVNPYKIDRNDYSIKDIEVEEIINLSNKLLGES